MGLTMGWGVNLPAPAQRQSFPLLVTPRLVSGMHKLRPAQGPPHPGLSHTWRIRNPTPCSLLRPRAPKITMGNQQSDLQGVGTQSNFLLPGHKTSHLAFKKPFSGLPSLHSPRVACWPARSILSWITTWAKLSKSDSMGQS